MNHINEIKIGIIAGEESGDQLGANLIHELRNIYKEASVTIVGVGGKALEKQGLKSLFDITKISLMGISEVLKKLPILLYYINKTANYFIKENIDCLIIIDSQDFTHRVAKRLKKNKKNVPIIQYIAPSVWAWRENRAKAIKLYIDELLVILPFEPEVLKKLEGPPATYVGHILASDKNIADIYKSRTEIDKSYKKEKMELLLLPGSRIYEITKLAPVFCNAAKILKNIKPELQISILTLPHLEDIIKKFVGDLPCNIGSSEAYKIEVLSRADIALAASGTVSLELALCNIIMVLAYKLDFFAKYFIKPRIKIWSAALPNIIANQPFIPEFYDENAKSNILAKHLEYLLDSKTAAQAQLNNFVKIRQIMETSQPSGKIAAKRGVQHIKAYRLSKER